MMMVTPLLVLSLSLAVAPAQAAPDAAIVNAHILPVSGPAIPQGTVLIEAGRITAVGSSGAVTVPAGVPTLDAAGRYLMPGLIDVHSHMGVYPWPDARAHGDGNEATAPLTPQVWAGDSIHISDPAFSRARAGGITTIQVLPGSANLVGGQSAVLKLREARTLDTMLFKGAPRGIKMACGENPKRVYEDDEDGPSTRMGSIATMRAALQEALDYKEARRRREPPPIDLDLEVLLDVLDGDIRVHVHCYRQDDIAGIYRVMDDYGVQIASIQHALEAYKVRDLIVQHDSAIATWPDWWGFKMEAYDAIPQNAALVKADGGVVALHSDSANTVQRMYTEAAKMLRYGASEQQALEMITLDPARLLGIEDRVGSIEVGKDADLALFSLHPLDAYTRVENTWIDGVMVFDRAAEGTPDARP